MIKITSQMHALTRPSLALVSPLCSSAHSAHSFSVAAAVWTAFDDLFNVLPLAALVNRRILCVHGGIGRLESLDQVQFQRKTHKMSTNVLSFRSKHMRITFLNIYIVTAICIFAENTLFIEKFN